MNSFMGGPSVRELVGFTRDWAELGLIDRVENLENDNVFVFSGTEDTVVSPGGKLPTISPFLY